MEYWNDGMMGYWVKTLPSLPLWKPIIPLFHYSIIPFLSQRSLCSLWLKGDFYEKQMAGGQRIGSQ
jgi:hypothetical protein